MDLDLDGRPALVSGGSRGIGLAVARGLAREGARVVIVSRHREEIEETAHAVARETGADIQGLFADMSVPADVERVVAEASSRLGGLQILVNAAARSGGPAPEDAGRVDPELLLRDFQEKTLGYFRAVRAAAPAMRRAGFGRIVSIGGQAAREAGSVSNGVRNAGLMPLTKAWALEYGPDGVTANVVLPALTLTERVRESLRREAAETGTAEEVHIARVGEQNAIGRLVTADEVAEVVVFLASPRAAAITGEAIAVTGGSDRAIRY